MTLDGAGHAMDLYTIWYHGSVITHIDALCHYSFEGKIYNGYARENITQGPGCVNNGIEHQKNGIMTRGILVDMPLLRNVPYLEAGHARLSVGPRGLGEVRRHQDRQRRRGVPPHRALGAARQGGAVERRRQRGGLPRVGAAVAEAARRRAPRQRRRHRRAAVRRRRAARGRFIRSRSSRWACRSSTSWISRRSRSEAARLPPLGVPAHGRRRCRCSAAPASRSIRLRRSDGQQCNATLWRRDGFAQLRRRMRWRSPPASLAAQQAPPTPAPPRAVDVVEKSIFDLQPAMQAGRSTSRQLVEAYLARIRAYDQAGPKINAFITLNPHALDEADALDAERQAQRRARPAPRHSDRRQGQLRHRRTCRRPAARSRSQDSRPTATRSW